MLLLDDGSVISIAVVKDICRIMIRREQDESTVIMVEIENHCKPH